MHEHLAFSFEQLVTLFENRFCLKTHTIKSLCKDAAHFEPQN